MKLEKEKFTAIKAPHLEDVEFITYYSRSFIGYLCDDCKMKPLHIMLQETSVYVKGYDGQTKWMIFLTEQYSLVKKYNTIWDKVSADIKKKN